MRELALGWYSLLSGLGAEVALPLRELAAGSSLPIFAALVLGLIGALSPCQLTTNTTAAAFLVRDGAGNSRTLRQVAAFVFGKVIVYSLLGVLAAVAGDRFSQVSIPMAVLARRVLGPAMILLGLHLMGLLPIRFALGTGVSGWLEARAGNGWAGAFFLGASFAFAFCPTLFLLFFGLTIPMMWSSPVMGLLYPGAFALGTVLPLMTVVGVFGLGFGTLRSFSAGLRRLSPYVPFAAGLVFLLAGLSDTLVYWLL